MEYEWSTESEPAAVVGRTSNLWALVRCCLTALWNLNPWSQIVDEPGGNGFGKAIIAQNIARAAAQAGHTVLFRTASDILADLHCDSPQILRRRLQHYARPSLLCIDELA